MPQEASHSLQAKHNRNFYKEIKSLPFNDWITTVIFYAALHYVDFFLAKFFGEHPETHRDRDELISLAVQRKKFSRDFLISFNRLLNDSKVARYKPDEWRAMSNSKRLKMHINDLDIIMNRK